MIRNRTQEQNAAQVARAQEMNMRNNMFKTQVEGQNRQFNRENQMINQGRKDAMTSGIIDSVTGYGQDLMTAQQYDQAANIMDANNPNFSLSQSQDNDFWRKVFQVIDPLSIKYNGSTKRIRENPKYIYEKLCTAYSFTIPIILQSSTTGFFARTAWSKTR